MSLQSISFLTAGSGKCMTGKLQTT